MGAFNEEKYKKLKKYSIPDKLFESKETECGSRTAALLNLFSEPCPELELHLNRAIDLALELSEDEKIEGLFHNLDVFRSVREVCVERHIPLISYSFSAIRKMHGYRQTLYFAGIDLPSQGSDDCKRRYQKYLIEAGRKPLFKHQDIISIFGKDRSLPYLHLLHNEPQYEIGIIQEFFKISPQYFSSTTYTSDDLLLDCQKSFPSEQITVRAHPSTLKLLGLWKDQSSAEPLPFILSCSRLTAVSSQTLLKGMLWNRTLVIPRDILPFSFVGAQDFKSQKKIDIDFVNFLFLCYLVPSGLLFNAAYWNWRKSQPSEREILHHHLRFYTELLNLPKGVELIEDDQIRIIRLLKTREVSSEEINLALHNLQK